MLVSYRFNFGMCIVNDSPLGSKGMTSRAEMTSILRLSCLNKVKKQFFKAKLNPGNKIQFE